MNSWSNVEVKPTSHVWSGKSFASAIRGEPPSDQKPRSMNVGDMMPMPKFNQKYQTNDISAHVSIYSNWVVQIAWDSS